MVLPTLLTEDTSMTSPTTTRDPAQTQVQPTEEQLAAFADQQRATWGGGDYDAVATRLQPVGDGIVMRVGVAPGELVLDVACGTGNATLPAARQGARVTGLDLTKSLLDVARAKARAEGLDIEWVEGDAMRLPFPDGSFDVVLSTFGCMFAPIQERAAAELVRVLRPGGRLGVAAWTPTGAVGAMFRVLVRHLPPPPAWVQAPLLWGDRGHARELFGPHGMKVEFAVDTVRFRYESAQEEIDRFASRFGPLVMARARLEPEGRWDALEQDLVAFTDESSTQHDDGYGYDAEYLIITGQKP
jgi:SAM-dependent methyltransferase